MNNQDFSDFFITKSQANEFKLGLSNIIDKTYETNFNLEKALAEEFGIGKKEKFLILLRESNIRTNFKEFLKSLDESISKLPIVYLSIAFEPNEETLKAISQWFIFNLNKQFLIDFKVDKKIIAGGVINFNGKFKDYSIRSLFDGIMKQKLNYHEVKTPALHQSTENMTIGR